MRGLRRMTSENFWRHRIQIHPAARAFEERKKKRDKNRWENYKPEADAGE